MKHHPSTILVESPPYNENAPPSRESRIDAWKESEMEWPPQTDAELLHWLEYCVGLRSRLANTPSDLRQMDGKIDLWISYGSQHPVMLRRLLHSGAIAGFALWNLVVWIDDIWNKFQIDIQDSILSNDQIQPR